MINSLNMSVESNSSFSNYFCDFLNTCVPVSYTHLDVYKRQAVNKLRGLKLFNEESRESLVSGALDFASEICEEIEIAIEKRGKESQER